ncbi:MAG: PQQ-binding-like beta-propeller repeat protein, partial [Anaerolineaceae bacterium]|nr:PQQ-binding-like beta-propeller repeat protein [Anaerolineaceae bacterium]
MKPAAPQLRAALLVVAAVLISGSAAAARGDKDQDDILATVNGDFVAENLLAQARQTAAGGDYDAAGRRYMMLVEQHGGAVVRVEGLLYRPVWRQVVDDLLQWPAAGLAAYRRQVDPEAMAIYRQAVADNDPAALEGLVQASFLSTTGDRAAIALADRLVESGRFALAAYYYLLVLENYPDLHLSADRIRGRALVAARLAGLDDRAAKLARLLQGRRTDRFGEGTLKELDRMAAARPAPDRRLGGRDHLTDRPTGLPSAVAWVRPLTTQLLRSRYPLSSTPAPCATYDRGRLYVTFQTSLWSLGAKSGEILWRYDTDGRSGNKDPVHFYYEQAHRPLVTEGAVITPLSRGGKEVVHGRVGGVVDLVALGAGDGHMLWRWGPRGKDLGRSPLAVDTAPIIEGERLFVPLATMANLFGEVQTAMLDRRTGRLLWRQGLGSHNNQLPLGRWSMPAAPFSTALQLRGGLLLSCGGGLLSAQSALSGAILWSRQMPQRRDYEVKLKLLKELPGMSFNG